MTAITWQCLSFNDMTTRQLYEAMVLRQEVFVVEQECAFLDADSIDYACMHLFGYVDKKLVAYSRLVPAGVVYEQCSIGRVVSAISERGKNIGRLLMKQSIDWIETNWGNQPIKIGAQQRLEAFYESFGFEVCSEPYMEDGILHVHMMRTASA